MAGYTNDSDYNNGLGVSSLYFLGDTSGFLTSDGIQTITNKTIDFSRNTILNAGTSGGSGGGSGDTIAPSTHDSNLIPLWGASNSKTLIAGIPHPKGTLVGTFDNQTLTNKSIDYNLNQIVNLPVYNDLDLVSGLSNLNLRTSYLEDTITTFDPRLDTLEAEGLVLDGRIDTNTDDITAVDLRVDAIEPELIILDERIDNIDPQLTTLSNNILTNINNINANTLRLDIVENDISANTLRVDDIELLNNQQESLFADINTNVSFLFTQAGGFDTQIQSNVISLNTKVIAPDTNTNNYIPQWDGLDSKTLKNGFQAPNSALVGVSDNQTLTSKTIDYNLNTILNLPMGSGEGGGGGYAPTASNITVVNSNIPVDITNVNNPYRFRANMTGSVNGGGGYAIMQANSKSYDPNNNYNTANYTYTVPITGTYSIIGYCTISVGGSGSNSLHLNINGSTVAVQTDIVSQSVKYNDTRLLTAGNTITMGLTVSNLNTGSGGFWAMILIAPSTPTTIPIVSTTNINAYSYIGEGNVMTGQSNTANYIPYWSSNNSTFLTDGINITDLTAYNLASATSSINISTATAPVANQVLTATSASNAIWATPSGGGCDFLGTVATTGSSTQLILTWAKVYKKIQFTIMNIKNNSPSAVAYLALDFSSNGGSTWAGGINLTKDTNTNTTQGYAVGEILCNDIVPLVKPFFLYATTGHDYYGNPKYLNTGTTTGTINALRFWYGGTTQFQSGTVYAYGYY